MQHEGTVNTFRVDLLYTMWCTLSIISPTIVLLFQERTLLAVIEAAEHVLIVGIFVRWLVALHFSLGIGVKGPVLRLVKDQSWNYSSDDRNKFPMI